MSATVRPSRPGDLAGLGALEKSGDALFRAADMHAVADMPTTPGADGYQDAHRAGRLLVAVDAADRPIGFVGLELLDGEPHVGQVSVHPGHAGHRIGADLLTAAEQWARARRYGRITLTTFRDVGWNGPYYRRLGWVVLPERQWGPELAAIRQHEADLGLDRWPREALVKHL